MTCQKCGNTLNEGARFCPKCGTMVETTVSSSREIDAYEEIPQNVEEKPSFFSRIWGVLSTIILILIVLFFLFKSGCFSPALNNNQGANTPEEIAVAIANYYKYGDISYLNNYFDKGMYNQEIEDGFKSNRDSLQLNTSAINMDKLNTTVAEMSEYSDGLKKCTITIHIQSGYGILENSYNISHYLHQAKTAQGVKWFLGQ